MPVKLRAEIWTGPAVNDTLVITAANQTDIASGRPGLVQGRETPFADHDNFECTAPPPPPPPKITDDFNRASLGSGWEPIEGSSWQTVSNATARPSTAYQFTALRRSELNFPADQYAQCETERDTVGDASEGGVMVRANASNTYYYVQLTASGNVTLYKRIAGVSTYIDNATPSVPPDTMVKLKLEAIGTTLKVYYNDSLVITALNQTDITSGKPGMTQLTGDAPFADHDNFECTAPV